MAVKLAELDTNSRMHLDALIEFLEETWQDDITIKLKLIQKYNLDLTDDEVLALFVPKVQSAIPTVVETTTTPIAPIKTLTSNEGIGQPERVVGIYGERWIVLQNRLLNAITNLDLNERRLIMFLSLIVRKSVDIDPHQRTFTVRVQDFVSEYGIKSKGYYGEFEKISANLQQKYYEFWNFGENKKDVSKIRVNWITKGEYKDNQGEIHIDLHSDVVEMLTVFDKSNPFTKYERKMITELGSYGIILFELIASCMHQEHKQKSYTIDYLREKFNCVDTYQVVSEFKRNVLDKAIKDIQDNTSYRISYKQKKQGRTISEIVFFFEDSKKIKDKSKSTTGAMKRDADNGDMSTIERLSDKQLGRITRNPIFMADYNHLVSPTSAAGQDINIWESEMTNRLKKDESQFKKRPIRDYLDY